jgi:hypothetical protein
MRIFNSDIWFYDKEININVIQFLEEYGLHAIFLVTGATGTILDSLDSPYFLDYLYFYVK